MADASLNIGNTAILFFFTGSGQINGTTYKQHQSRSMKFVTKIMFVLLLFILIRYFFNIKSISRTLQFEKKPNLIIGILSAPQNFEQRLSVRKTWLKLTSYVPAEYYFLIGRENCDVHPLDRLTPYSCVENEVSLPRDADAKTIFSSIMEQRNFEVSPQPVTGFGFYVIFDIVITKLGVTAKLLRKATSTIRVKLLSSFDKSVLSSVTFDPDEDAKDSGRAFKKIKPLLLPKQYEATIVLESVDDVVQECDDWTWDSRFRPINITQIIKKGEKKPRPFKFNTCSHVFMEYNIPDINKLKKFINFKETRKKEQKEFNEILAAKLKNESMKYNDLLLLNVTDVYENLTEKMIQFYLRISKENNVNYILKTDDDSFIDLLRVHNQLHKFENGSTREKLWWWSHFKEFWAVPSSGKWKDDEYRSISYPPFPCGGGYVINKEIVDYIAKNFNHLERFQGEDISLGIWLSGLSVTRPENFSKENSIQQFIWNKFGEGNHFKFLVRKQCRKFKTAVDGCDWTCDNEKRDNTPLCNKVQLSTGEMYEIWEDFKIKGYL